VALGDGAEQWAWQLLVTYMGGIGFAPSDARTSA